MSIGDPIVEPASRDEADIREAITTLRGSGVPVDAATLRGLYDPRLREQVQTLLEGEGRTLVGPSESNRYVVAFSDDVRRELASRRIGVLRDVDRAVLCLCLLHCVAIPRARSHGGSSDAWTAVAPFSTDDLLRRHRGRGLSQENLRDGIRRLKLLGLLRAGRDIAPGPALSRLTPECRAELWEDMVLVCAPDSLRARHIVARRGGGAAA